MYCEFFLHSKSYFKWSKLRPSAVRIQGSSFFTGDFSWSLCFLQAKSWRSGSK